MHSFLVIALISTALIRFSLLLLNLRRPPQFSEKHSWELVNDDRDDNFDRLNGDQILPKTTISKNGNEYGLSNVFKEHTNKLQLHSLAHSDGEHYLTTISISFHLLEKQSFLDVTLFDKEFSRTNNQFSFLFTNNVQWDFDFWENNKEETTHRIVLSSEQLRYLSEKKLDKWRIKRKTDHYYTIGNLNFDTRKHFYKQEIQETIKTMAGKIYEYLINSKI